MTNQLPSHIWIDCYGRSWRDEIHVQAQGIDFSFIYNPAKKKDKSFSLGLYLDHAVIGNDVFNYPLERRIAVLLESPLLLDQLENRTDLTQRFKHIFTHRKSRFEVGPPYAPLFFGTTFLETVWERDYKKNKLVSFIGSLEHPKQNSYALRSEVACLCLENPMVDCYGKGINPIKSKMTGLADYAFSIAMENIREDYYFTEKLIDCFLTETVPIYWGARGIGNMYSRRIPVFGFYLPIIWKFSVRSVLSWGANKSNSAKNPLHASLNFSNVS